MSASDPTPNPAVASPAIPSPAPPTPGRASVVVPARDAAASVGQTVRALLAQDPPPLEVIVVDDGSRDGTGEVARAAGAGQVLRAEGQGPARARNLGLQAARGELIVFTDADCTPRPGFLRALLAPLADPAVAGVKGAYESEQRGLTPRFVQVEYEERYRRMARRASIDFIDTYAAAYRRAALLEAGGFDERYPFPSTEDQELSFRLVERGARLVFAPEARVAHLHAATLAAYARKKARIGYWKVATLRRHPGKAVDDAHTPGTLKLQLLLAPAALGGIAIAAGGAAAGWPLRALPAGALPALLFLLTTLPLTLAALRRDPPVGLLTPAFCLVRALALGWGVLRGLLAEARGGVLAPAAGHGAGLPEVRGSP